VRTGSVAGCEARLYPAKELPVPFGGGVGWEGCAFPDAAGNRASRHVAALQLISIFWRGRGGVRGESVRLDVT
jgi:hypothetical protein